MQRLGYGVVFTTAVIILLSTLVSCDRWSPPGVPSNWFDDDPFELGEVRTAVSTVEVNASGESVAPRADSILLSPLEVRLVPGQRFIFGAVVLDPLGVPIAGAAVRWRVENPVVGSITDRGLFTAGNNAGRFPDAVVVDIVGDPELPPVSADVIVSKTGSLGAGPLKALGIYPPDIVVRPGQLVGLGAIGWDSRGRFVQNISLAWEMADPMAGSVDEFGFFLATEVAGQYPKAVLVTATQNHLGATIEVTGSVSVTVTESASEGILTTVIVVPRFLAVRPGQQIDLFARAFDQSGQRLLGIPLNWRVDDPLVGVVDRNGYYRAGSVSGEYIDGIKVAATQRLGEDVVRVEATISVRIDEGDASAVLTMAQLVPSEVTLSTGQRFLFRAFGLDENGDGVPAEIVWRVNDSDVGTIDDKGVFTPGVIPGVYKDVLSAELKQESEGVVRIVRAFSTINLAGPLSSVEIVPSRVTVETGRSVRLRARGFDEAGLPVTNLKFSWRIRDDDAGEINSAGATAFFTAGSIPKVFADAVELTATELISK